MKRRLNSRGRLAVFSVILALLLALIAYVDAKTRPLVEEYAESNMKIILNNYISSTISEVLEEENVSYTDISTVKRNSDDAVESIEINTIKISVITSKISEKVQKNVDEKEYLHIGIPIGTILGNDFTLGRGPQIKIKLRVNSAVFLNTKSRFCSAGINQTLHEITAEISSEVYIMMPLYRTTTTVTSEFLLAQTVIVGDVPEAYTNVNDFSGEGDIQGNINDYGAEPID